MLDFHADSYAAFVLFVRKQTKKQVAIVGVKRDQIVFVRQFEHLANFTNISQIAKSSG